MSRYGPGAIQRSNRLSPLEQATESFERAYASSAEEADRRRALEEQREFEAPLRERQKEQFETGLFQQGYRRGTAPTVEEPGDPVGVRPPALPSVAAGLRQQAQLGRPRIIAPPGAFVPGMGFSREPVLDRDLEERDQIGFTAQDALRAPSTPPRQVPAPGMTQVDEDLYYDESQSPAGRERALLQQRAKGQAEAFARLRRGERPPLEAVDQFLASGGDLTDLISATRAETGGGGAPTFRTDEQGNVVQWDPATGTWKPSMAQGGKQLRGQEPMQILNTEAGFVRRPTRGAEGPTGDVAPLNKGERTTEQKFQENLQTTEEIERVIDLVKANPRAFGLQNVIGRVPLVGSALRQKVSGPEKVKVQAAVAKLGALQMHKLYGSAQSVGELMKAQGFSPDLMDDADTVIVKLESILNELERENIALQAVRRNE